eukprot:gene37058-48386_t
MALQELLTEKYSKHPNYNAVLNFLQKDEQIVFEENYSSEAKKIIVLEALSLELSSHYKELLDKFEKTTLSVYNMEEIFNSLSENFQEDVKDRWKNAQLKYKNHAGDIKKHLKNRKPLDWSFIKSLAHCELLPCEFFPPVPRDSQLHPLLGVCSFLARNALVFLLEDGALTKVFNLYLKGSVQEPEVTVVMARSAAFHEKYIDRLGIVTRFERHMAMCIALYDEHPDNYVSPYISICQASGMGKSRLIKEYANTHPVSYFSFSTGFSYPPRTACVMDNLISLIKSHQSPTKGAKDNDDNDSDYDDDRPKEPFTSFIISAVMKVIHLVNQKQMTCKEVFDRQVPAPDSNDKHKPFWKWNYLNIEKPHLVDCKEYTLKEATIVFDEARYLVENFGAYGVSYFRTMRRSLVEAYKSLNKIGISVIAIFMDTSSRVANFTPTHENDPSARMGFITMQLLPPFYMVTTVDCLADLKWPMTLKEAFTARRLASFARPLIAKFIPDNNNNSSIITSNYYNYNSPPTEKEIARELVEFFVFKVFGKSFIGDSLGNLRLTESERISVLCLRITINVIASSQLADTLSAKHMRIITDISEDRKLISTDAPNEPVLSEAAAQIMSAQSSQTVFIYSLYHQLFVGGIAAGFC